MASTTDAISFLDECVHYEIYHHAATQVSVKLDFERPIARENRSLVDAVLKNISLDELNESVGLPATAAGMIGSTNAGFVYGLHAAVNEPIETEEAVKSLKRLVDATLPTLQLLGVVEPA